MMVVDEMKIEKNEMIKWVIDSWKIKVDDD